MDIRTKKLAQLIVKYSVFVKHNENVVISGSTEAEEFIRALYEEVIKAGGHPILKLTLPGLTHCFYKHAQPHHIEKFPDDFEYIVKNSKKYIGILTESNTRELTNCDSGKISSRSKVMNPIVEHIANSKPLMHRVLVGFPCQALAQEAEMSLSEYEDFVFDACLQDWPKLGKLMDKILKKFKKNSEVWIVGDGVDLKMKVHGDKAGVDKGEENMPGGEVFMAPVRESLNGWIKFDYPSVRDGKEVAGIELVFKDGRVVEAKATKNLDYLKKMLAVDKNASFVGELGLGCNPKIKKYTNNLLFDEKIGGTIHLALGSAYKENGGGNDSALHWDIVKNMKKAKIIVDGKVIQDKGVWKI
ncbi:MAG: aminopeptidase [Candidatus Vogelbacteria bacterium]|nr:aminopeptidase [Candidatus Vogelbacteria bacterium]